VIPIESNMVGCKPNSGNMVICMSIDNKKPLPTSIVLSIK
jgi:hypothetical protein